jgi:hypothetical protein
MPSSVKIPLSLFDTLQNVFKIEAKQMCRDVAKILKRPEKEIIEKVFQHQISLQIIQDNDITISCPVFLKKDSLLERCRKSCVLGTGRCLSHQSVLIIPEIPSTVQILTRLEYNESQHKALWCDEVNGNVYNTEGKFIGFYKDESLQLFEIEESEDT